MRVERASSVVAVESKREFDRPPAFD